MLFAAAASRGLRILNRIRLTGFEQDAHGVRAETRRAIGAHFLGDAAISRTQSSYTRAPRLLAWMQAPPAWSTHQHVALAGQQAASHDALIAGITGAATRSLRDEL